MNFKIYEKIYVYSLAVFAFMTINACGNDNNENQLGIKVFVTTEIDPVSTYSIDVLYTILLTTQQLQN